MDAARSQPVVAASGPLDVDRRPGRGAPFNVGGDGPAVTARVRKVELDGVPSPAWTLKDCPLGRVAQPIQPAGVQYGRQIAAPWQYNDLGDVRPWVASSTSRQVDESAVEPGESQDAAASPGSGHMRSR